MSDADVTPARSNRGRIALIIAAVAAVLVAVIVIANLNSSPETPAETTPAPTPSATASATAPAPEEGAWVTRDGADLLLGGEPFRYAGTNSYELMYSQPPVVDVFLDRMVENDLNVLRSWAFFDIGTENGDLGVEISNKGTYYQYWDAAAGEPAYNDGANGLEKLDYLVASAKERDVKLIFALVNNWTNFGGMDQYVRWAGGDEHDDFITDPQIKQWYKNWVEHLLERTNTITGVKYKDEPTIIAWELANEMRCSESGPYPSGPGCTSENIVAWVDEMSTFVRSIDPNHLIAFGSEGFLCTEPGGDDWLTNCAETGDPEAITNLPNIDMNGIHIYPDHWATDAAWSTEWILTHADIATRADKPFYIGEYGWRDKNTRIEVYDQWLAAFYENGGDGSNFWLMQPYREQGKIPDYDGFTVYCPSAHCQLIRNYGLQYGGGVDPDTFFPIADGDFFSTVTGVPVTFDPFLNDLAYGATIDRTSIDLDPETEGQQLEFASTKGIFSATADGMVTFTPDADASGSGRVSYTVLDTLGRISNSVNVGVSIVLDESELEASAEPTE